VASRSARYPKLARGDGRDGAAQRVHAVGGYIAHVTDQERGGATKTGRAARWRTIARASSAGSAWVTQSGELAAERL